MNKLLSDKSSVIANFQTIKTALFDTAALELEASELQSEMAVVMEMLHKSIEENARTAMNQDEYQKRYEGLASRYDAVKARHDGITAQISQIKATGDAMECFIAELRKQEGLISTFDERLWYSLLDFATVYSENDVRFTFKDGTEKKA